MDRTVLRAMKEEAELNKDYVDLFFCDVLLSLIREVLDDSVEPQGADLTATVVIKERHVDDAPPLDLRDQFLAGIPALLDVLEVRCSEVLLLTRNVSEARLDSEAVCHSYCMVCPWQVISVSSTIG